MPRSKSRSRSPVAKRVTGTDRRRSRSRERERPRRPNKRRSRSRSPRRIRRRSKSDSPARRRSRSPRSLSNDKDPDNVTPTAPVIDESKLEGLDEEGVDMMKLMGFATFDTTKGKKVAGNNVSAVNIQRKRRYRQYMNRKGGFNRPLDFIA